MKILNYLLAMVYIASVAMAQKTEISLPGDNTDVSQPEKQENTEVAKAVSETSAVVITPVGVDLLSLDVALFEKIRRPLGLERLLLQLPSLECMAKRQSPLRLDCFRCNSQQASAQWNFIFARESLDAESCELARVERLSTSMSQFPRTKKLFQKSLRTLQIKDWQTVGEALQAQLDERIYQISETKVFDLPSNEFRQQQNLSLSFEIFSRNQKQIDAVKEQWLGFRSALAQVTWNEFGDFLFPEDKSDLRLLLMDFLQEQMRPIPKTEGLGVDSGYTIEFASQEKFLRAIFYYASQKQKAELRGLYRKLFEQLKVHYASQSLFDSFSDLVFLQWKPVIDDRIASSMSISKPYAVSWVESEPLNTQAQQIFGALQTLHGALVVLPNTLPCEQLDGQIEGWEKTYQDFFKGQEAKDYFRSYRAYLVVRLLENYEAKYFYLLQQQLKVSEETAIKENSKIAQSLAAVSEKIQAVLGRLAEYQQELQELVPSLEDSLRVRREWMLQGLNDAEVFSLCLAKQ